MLQVYLETIDDAEDKLTLEDIYNMYKTKLYYIAFGILNNSEDSEDAVHDAFILIANNIKIISGMNNDEIVPYIVTIIRNVSLNIYRKNKMRSEQTKKPVINKYSYDTDFFDSVDYNSLVQAIMELPPNYKDVIYLYYIKEMSAKEIAKLLKITPNTVWKRNERAKKLLKEKLKELDIYV